LYDKAFSFRNFDEEVRPSQGPQQSVSCIPLY